VLSTPNKMFECIMAGVPVVASDFPDMRRIVIGEGVGDVADPTDPRQISDTVSRLLADPGRLATMRDRARSVAHATYNWDAQAAELVRLYRSILPVPGSRPEP
jgi:glycosyltransferase involved in cell wall biosynthesis